MIPKCCEDAIVRFFTPATLLSQGIDSTSLTLINKVTPSICVYPPVCYNYTQQIIIQILYLKMFTEFVCEKKENT